MSCCEEGGWGLVWRCQAGSAGLPAAYPRTQTDGIVWHDMKSVIAAAVKQQHVKSVIISVCEVCVGQAVKAVCAGWSRSDMRKALKWDVPSLAGHGLLACTLPVLDL